MTSQPEAALTEAQKLLSTKQFDLSLAQNELTRLRRSVYSTEDEIREKRNEVDELTQAIVKAQATLIALQAVRIASLERENAAAVGKLRTARPLLAGSWSLLSEAESEVRYQHRKHGEPIMATDPLFYMKVKHHLDALQAWNRADVGIDDAADASGVTE